METVGVKGLNFLQFSVPR